MVRLIIVSNRLPVTIRPDKEPPENIEQSSGGLVSALRSVVNDYEEAIWIGWPGNHCENEDEEQKTTELLAQWSTTIKMVPVWLCRSDAEDFYNGFSNASLWPLLHWMPPYARFRKSWSDAYKRVNQIFVDTIIDVAHPDDFVWIHDYHLFLAPQLLRDTIAIRCGVPSPVARPKDLPPPLPHDFSEVSTAEDAEQVPILTRKVSFQQDDRSSAFSRKMSRDSLLHLKVGFFLHTPFPSFEVMGVLPICVDIVEGMLGADMIGFHTYNYLRHFRSCVIRLCGFTPEMDVVQHMGRRTQLGVFPIGANCQDIGEAIKSDTFKEHLREYTTQFQGKSLVLSVERLDYTKGMPQKLAAIERYLEEAEKTDKIKRQRKEGERAPSPQEEERAEVLEGLQKKFEERVAQSCHKGLRTSMNHKLWQWVRARPEKDEPDHAKTVFLFIAVPSRQSVQEYQNIEEEVHRTISTINGRFSTVNHTPIVYIHRSVSHEELVALYSRADCCLVTPLVDGMNLVAKEFVAAKDKTVENAVPGTIVLSELAGAAQELFDALVVNPYDVEAVADAIHISLELTKGTGLDEESCWAVTDRMRNAVLKNDAQAWARRFLAELGKINTNNSIPSAVYTLIDFTAACFFERAAGTKAIFIDFDGCLKDLKIAEFAPLLCALSKRGDLKIVIVSGMSAEYLDKQFGVFANLNVIAEHGLLLRRAGAQRWERFGKISASDWMEKIRPVLELFERCTPDSRVEVRTTSIVWDYSKCDESYGLFKTKELVHQLAMSIGNLPCQVCEGNSIVEVVSIHQRKGCAVQQLCAEQERTGNEFSSILCISDDRADETLYQDAPPMAYTVRVGSSETRARHRFADWAEARHFLQLICEQNLPGAAVESSRSCIFKSIDERRHSTSDTLEEDPFLGLQDTEEGA